jgi:hypothetical protein
MDPNLTNPGYYNSWRSPALGSRLRHLSESELEAADILENMELYSRRAKSVRSLLRCCLKSGYANQLKFVLIVEIQNNPSRDT